MRIQGFLENEPENLWNIQLDVQLASRMHEEKKKVQAITSI